MRTVFDPKAFARVWNASRDLKSVADRFGTNESKVIANARAMRRDGYDLKSIPGEPRDLGPRQKVDYNSLNKLALSLVDQMNAIDGTILSKISKPLFSGSYDECISWLTVGCINWLDGDDCWTKNEALKIMRDGGWGRLVVSETNNHYTISELLSKG